MVCKRNSNSNRVSILSWLNIAVIEYRLQMYKIKSICNRRRNRFVIWFWLHISVYNFISFFWTSHVISKVICQYYYADKFLKNTANVKMYHFCRLVLTGFFFQHFPETGLIIAISQRDVLTSRKELSKENMSW